MVAFKLMRVHSLNTIRGCYCKLKNLKKKKNEKNNIPPNVIGLWNEWRKTSHNGFSSEPHSPHVLVRATSKSCF